VNFKAERGAVKKRAEPENVEMESKIWKIRDSRMERGIEDHKLKIKVQSSSAESK
jgi:hypothetical protein